MKNLFEKPEIDVLKIKTEQIMDLSIGEVEIEEETRATVPQV